MVGNSCVSVRITSPFISITWDCYPYHLAGNHAFLPFNQSRTRGAGNILILLNPILEIGRVLLVFEGISNR